MNWGRDWPNVGYENVTDYDKQYALMQRLLRDAAARNAVMVHAPTSLYRF